MLCSRIISDQRKIALLIISIVFVTFCVHNLRKGEPYNNPVLKDYHRMPPNVPTSDQKEHWTKLIASHDNLPQDKLIEVIRNVFVDSPPPLDSEYHFDKTPPKITGQIGIPVIIDKILGGKRNGFFIEAGGLDGEAHSNTLLFELKRNYSGEVKGWASKDVNDNAKVIQAVCLPLMSILYAIGNPTIDYFSLDIEGVELDVLKTIPWDKVDIKILSIEVGNNGRENYGEKVDKLMIQAGYTKVLDMCCDKWELDNVYVRNDYRSSLDRWKDDGKPRLIKDKFNQYGKVISKKTNLSNE